MTEEELRHRTGDPRQFASVRAIELSDGPERGVRALAFSTGGGLDFWVTVDRSLDIGPLWHRGVPVAWQGAAGFRTAFLHDPEADGGFGWGRGFAGFLMTVGLEHARAPANGSPQHGRLPVTPARLLGHGEDWVRGVLFCEGEVAQFRNGGENLLLRRRIEADIGGTVLRIADRVVNHGPAVQDHHLLYHFNLGWPAIDDGTHVVCAGAELVAPVRLGSAVAPSVAMCRPAGPGWTVCEVLPAGIRFGFDTDTLPFLQTWHDVRPRVGVLSVEPCTSMRRDDATSEAPIRLRPGEGRDMRVEVAFGP